MNMTLKNNVQRLFNYAGEHKIDLQIAEAKMRDDIASGRIKNMSMHDLDEAVRFADKYYNEIVYARNNDDYVELDKLF